MTVPGFAPLTAERTMVGTLHYMAPEQLEGRELDPRADILALGAVLYEMLSGGRAFDGDSSASVIAAIMNGARTPLIDRAPKGPPALVRLIDRCLAVDPRDRWQSARDLAYALRDPAGGSSASNAALPAAVTPQRRSWLPMVVPIAAGVAIASLGWLWLPHPQPAVLERAALVRSQWRERGGSRITLRHHGRARARCRRVALGRLDVSSPDEERFSANLWLFDLPRRVVSRFTVDPAATDENPVWSPDGTEIAYAVHKASGLADVLVRSTTGSAPSRVRAQGMFNFRPIHWARDGTLLLHAYATGGGADDLDLYLVGPEPEATPRPFLVMQGSQAPSGSPFCAAPECHAFISAHDSPVALLVRHFRPYW